MEIKVKRKWKKEAYTIGKMYIDGEYVCDTLEDKDRGLISNMSVAQICGVKVHGETAIPTGRYLVDMKTVSPRFGGRAQYQFCKGRLPRLCNTVGFQGVLIHCLTPDMEVLTELGWQNLKDFKASPASRCYSYNVDNGKIELVDINRFIERDYNGKLYCCDGRRVCYSVTDEHRMYVGNKKNNSTHEWGFRMAKDLPKNAVKFKVAAKHDGEALTAQQKAFYYLIMATQADGYIINWNTESSQVRFHFTKERKIKRVVELVEQAGGTCKMRVDKERKTHIILDRVLSNEIAEVMNPCRYMCNTKELPMELLNLRSEDIKDLLLEYLFFDGRYENYLRNNKNMTISSTNMRTLDTLQAMATMCGMRSYIKNENSKFCYAIVLYEEQSEVTPEPYSYYKEDYEGKVWCLSNANTTLIVRKNKRPMIIGNCGNTAQDTEGCILVGENKAVGQVLNSTAAFRKVYAKLKAADERGEQIWITIE